MTVRRGKFQPKTTGALRPCMVPLIGQTFDWNYIGRGDENETQWLMARRHDNELEPEQIGLWTPGEDIEFEDTTPADFLARIASLSAQVEALTEKLAYFEHMAGEDAKQVEALTKERDAYMGALTDAEAAESIAELAAQVEALSKALEPFAKEADKWPSYDDNARTDARLGHCRLARAALNARLNT